LNNKLDFQTARAEEYEEKYKSILKYKNQEESLQELDEKLREKENEIVNLLSQGN
jgi:23S rRNA maturation mini-RNase III